MASEATTIRRRALSKARSQQAIGSRGDLEISHNRDRGFLRARAKLMKGRFKEKARRESSCTQLPVGRASLPETSVKEKWAALVQELAFFAAMADKACDSSRNLVKDQPAPEKGTAGLERKVSASRKVRNLQEDDRGTRQRLVGSAVRIGELRTQLDLERRGKAQELSTVREEMRLLEQRWEKRVCNARMERENQFQDLRGELSHSKSQSAWLWDELRSARARAQQLEHLVNQYRGTRPDCNSSVGEVSGGPDGERNEALETIQAPDPLKQPEVAGTVQPLSQTEAEQVAQLRGEIGGLKVYLEAARKERDELALMTRDFLSKLEVARAGEQEAKMQARAEIAEARSNCRQLVESHQSRSRIDNAIFARKQQLEYMRGFEECRLLSIQVDPRMGEFLHVPEVVRSEQAIEADEAVDGDGSQQRPFDLND